MVGGGWNRRSVDNFFYSYPTSVPSPPTKEKSTSGGPTIMWAVTRRPLGPHMIVGVPAADFSFIIHLPAGEKEPMDEEPAVIHIFFPCTAGSSSWRFLLRPTGRPAGSLRERSSWRSTDGGGRRLMISFL